jgi:hypothetical protein
MQEMSLAHISVHVKIINKTDFINNVLFPKTGSESKDLVQIIYGWKDGREGIRQDLNTATLRGKLVK